MAPAPAHRPAKVPSEHRDHHFLVIHGGLAAKPATDIRRHDAYAVPGHLEKIGEGEIPEKIEQEFQQQLFRLAAEQVRDGFAPKTWRAFWGTAVEGRSAAEVGAELGLSVGAVYVARSRVLARLTVQVQELQAEAEG